MIYGNTRTKSPFGLRRFCSHQFPRREKNLERIEKYYYTLLAGVSYEAIFLLAFTLIIVLLSINQANFHFVSLFLSCSKGELFSNLI